MKKSLEKSSGVINLMINLIKILNNTGNFFNC